MISNPKITEYQKVDMILGFRNAQIFTNGFHPRSAAWRTRGCGLYGGIFGGGACFLKTIVNLFGARRTKTNTNWEQRCFRVLAIRQP
jgi:hypothetical protein